MLLAGSLEIAGRDGKQSLNVILYHGQQLCLCDKHIKQCIKVSTCLCVAFLKQFVDDLEPLNSGHDCCSSFHQRCKCGGDKCNVEIPPLKLKKLQRLCQLEKQVFSLSCQSKKWVVEHKQWMDIDSVEVDRNSVLKKEFRDSLERNRNWCFENYLLLNPDKTKLVIYGSRQMLRKMPSFSLTMLGKDLKPSEPVKDLGVIFDQSLSFDAYITSLVSSCFSKLGQISCAKYAFNKELLIAIINALVFSKLYYCSSVWSGTTNKDIDKLQLVQNFAARICCRVRKFDHITPALKN
ncbi:hypothetical protein ACROYT_G015520 [Oculina patagonica]